MPEQPTNHENPYESPATARSGESPTTELPREIVLEGSMPVNDVLHTQILVLSCRWVYAVLCLVMYVGFVFACAMLNPGGSLFGSTFTVLGLLVMPAILPFTLLMVYLRLLRDSKNRVGIFAVTSTVLAADGIHSRSDQATGTIPWTSFGGFLASSRVVLLFLKDSNNHLIVSRNKLAEPKDWPVLLEFLHARFPRH